MRSWVAINAYESGASSSMQCHRNRYDGQSGVESGQHQPAISVCRDELFPGAIPFFDHDEAVKDKATEQWMEAARRVACVLALHGVRSFGRVLSYLKVHRPDDVARWVKTDRMKDPEEPRIPYARALDILCLIADNHIIPNTARKAASHCGGLAPGEGENHPDPHDADWLQWADLGNATYQKLMLKLLHEGGAKGWKLQSRSRHGYEQIASPKWEKHGDVIKAYLAAADAAKKLYDYIDFHTVAWQWEYKSLVGGTFDAKDEVTNLITDCMKRYHANFVPKP